MSDIAPKSVASRYLQRAVQSEEDSIVYNFISLPFISSFLVSGARKYASNYDLVHHTTAHTHKSIYKQSKKKGKYYYHCSVKIFTLFVRE